MKRKILLFVIRCIKMLKMQDKLIPELEQQPQCAIRPHRLYQHYGRIVLSHSNPDVVYATFTDDRGKELTEKQYFAAFSQGKPCYITQAKGRACYRCAIHKIALPCRCDFKDGVFSGYYELVYSPKQYSDNPVID